MDRAVRQIDYLKESLSAKPRLGFLGVGWIGGHRLKSMVEKEAATVAAICDPSTENGRKVRAVCPQAIPVARLSDLLALRPDGIVIATPSAQHAGQAIAALEAGIPVFCQKPLALDAAMTRRVVAAARTNNCLLGVDLSYRHLRGLERLRRMISEGAIGKVFAVDLVFHNAYGPDKSWYYDKRHAGGGCIIDLGTHMVDLMLHVLGNPSALQVAGQLFCGGSPLDGRGQVEDYGVVQIMLENDISVRLACSWHLQAGREADIRATFYGTRGGLCIRNVDGSFFFFQAEHYQGTRCEVLEPPSDDWWGAAAVTWARRLSENPRYDPEVERLVKVAEILDAVYGDRPRTRRRKRVADTRGS